MGMGLKRQDEEEEIYLPGQDCCLRGWVWNAEEHGTVLLFVSLLTTILYIYVFLSVSFLTAKYSYVVGVV